MKSISGKLKSESGATILMAFLMLLVAVTVSAVIVMASVTAAKNAASDIASQQDMLDASAAAELIKNQLDGARYEWKQTTYYEDRFNSIYSSMGDPVVTVSGCDFPELIKDAVSKAKLGFTYSTTMTISEPNMGDVEAVLKMVNSASDDYKITVELSSAEGGENSAHMLVFAYGTYNEYEDVGWGTKTAVRTVRWSNSEIRKGAAE